MLLNTNIVHDDEFKHELRVQLRAIGPDDSDDDDDDDDEELPDMSAVRR